MASLKPHRRQFIVTTTERPKQLLALPGFRTRRLGDGIYLHHDEDLLIKDDGERLILGRMLRPGDGRYVVILGGRLSLDATGSLGVHYFSEGSVICSSSPTLLSLFTGRSISRPDRTIKLNWLPSPRGVVEGSRRLMIDQTLDLTKREVGVEKRVLKGPRTVESAAEQLARESIGIAQALQTTGRPLYVALTGGQDSRTIFSAFIRARVPFKAFTLLLSDGASHRDARIATNLCEIHQIEHILVKGENRRKSEHRKLYLEHSSGIDGDRGRQYADGNYYRILPDGAIVAHGGSLGLSKRPFDHYFDNPSQLSRQFVLGALNANLGPIGEEQVEAIGEWYHHRTKYPISSLGDSFFIDQRRATWGADNRFAEDIFGFEWYLFANSWRLVDAFLSVPKEARDGLIVQKRAIDIMTPGLNDKIPDVNPPMGLVDRMRGRFSRRGMLKIYRRIRGMR